MKKILAVFIASILLAPAYVGAQSRGIVLLDSFGEFSKGDSVFIYGNATTRARLVSHIENYKSSR